MEGITIYRPWAPRWNTVILVSAGLLKTEWSRLDQAGTLSALETTSCEKSESVVAGWVCWGGGGGS